MATINTQYNSYVSLASYLNSSNSSSLSSTSSSTTPSLVTLLGNDSADNSGTNNSSDLLSLLEQNANFTTYNLPTDANGNTYIPTVDQMNNAATPDAKLTLANYVAQSVLMQSNASSQTDNATRVSDIASQAQSVLQAVSSATTDLAHSSDGISSNQQKTISQTLNAMQTALQQVVNLLPKTASTTRAALTSRLSDLDALAYNIAGASGTAWTSVTGNSANTIAGYSADTATTTSNANALSNNLLNILV